MIAVREAARRTRRSPPERFRKRSGVAMPHEPLS